MEGLILQDIKVGYDKKSVISHISLSVVPGQTLVLMGLSGAGKTTLLRSILGIIKPEEGAILLNNTNITHMPLAERNIGYVPQNYGLFPHLDVFENIAYGLRARNMPIKDLLNAVSQMMERMGLQGFDRRRVDQISSGQQQRVALARALVIHPALLLLDEPLSNIDQATKLEVATFLKDLFASLQIPIIFVTHQYEDAQFLQATIAILIDGVIEQIGSYQELINNPKQPLVKQLLSPFSVIIKK